MKDTYQKGSGMVWTIVGVVAIIIIVIVVLMTGKKPSDDVVASDTTTLPADTANPSATTTAGTPAIVPDKKFVYKNGTYTAMGDYNSPGGAEQIKVTVIVKDDVVTDAVAVAQATRPQSVHFQGIFVSNFKQFVVGKNIADIALDKVAGSSLTPAGFNDALAKIKVEAQA